MFLFLPFQILFPLIRDLMSGLTPVPVELNACPAMLPHAPIPQERTVTLTTLGRSRMCQAQTEVCLFTCSHSD